MGLLGRRRGVTGRWCNLSATPQLAHGRKRIQAKSRQESDARRTMIVRAEDIAPPQVRWPAGTIAVTPVLYRSAFEG